MSRKIITHLQNLLAHEQGAVVREWGHRRPVALVYPNEYHVGMSNLGFQTIYHLLNAHPDLACERVFLPGEAELQEYQRCRTPLLSLESQRPLTDFAAVAFSLSFEPDYLNVLKILELAHIPLLACPPGRALPRSSLPAASPPCSTPSPWPRSWTPSCWGKATPPRPSFLTSSPAPAWTRRLAAWQTLARQLPGVYVPAAYHPDYHPDGTLSRVTACARVSRPKSPRPTSPIWLPAPCTAAS